MGWPRASSRSAWETGRHTRIGAVSGGETLMSTSVRAIALPKVNSSLSASGASGSGGLISTCNSLPEGRLPETSSGRIRTMPERA